MTEQETKFKEVWDVLSKIDVEPMVEKKNTKEKNAPRYLSWMSAWKLANDNFPGVEIEVREWDGKPYLVDPVLGIMVETKCTINGVSRSERLPVMDSSFKAQKMQPWEYEVAAYSNGNKTYDPQTGKPLKNKKVVEAATMFDINTAIQRCKAKNLAIFGLGYKLYVKEDILKYINDEEQKEQIRESNDCKDVFYRIDSCKTSHEVIALMKGEFAQYNSGDVHDYAIKYTKQLQAQERANQQQYNKAQ